MKLLNSILIILMLSLPAEAGQGSENEIVKPGDSIALHWSENCLLRKYGDGKPLMEWPRDFDHMYPTMMWRVGKGILVIEYTVGIGLIARMSYVIKDTNGNVIAIFTVKKFNPKTGEIIIAVPNQSLKQTGRTNATVEHF